MHMFLMLTINSVLVAKRIEFSEGSTGLQDFQIDFQMVRRGGLLYIVSIHSRKIYSKLFGNYFQNYYICVEFKNLNKNEY